MYTNTGFINMIILDQNPQKIYQIQVILIKHIKFYHPSWNIGLHV